MIIGKMKDIKIDYIPAWDFRSPNKEVKDTSAGAIAASGMLELSQFDENGSYYRENAIKILSALNGILLTFSITYANNITDTHLISYS